ncbi:DUF4296 domain-containing protein [Hymenobacter sp. GOD-10R]|uniref:DUF4296 domain-containing protein n=1 Tax=Hymenobacter sp. GOD-10R TaxID=3093922 RepID=UPI002D7936B2|nr:DUF4296 domain-containing protein [Hymenobacter sp. GOD-10R]WRQ30209.1 DUF4296 domain-containing protein [Hymenobacter sp. GOD-10R]
MKNLPARLRLFLSVLLTLAFAQCQRPEEPMRPQLLLPKDKMTSLLTNLHLAEARVEASRLAPDSARAMFNQLRRDLFWRYETTDSAFYQSYRYYAVHDKDLDKIYGDVIDSLSMREMKLGEKK